MNLKEQTPFYVRIATLADAPFLATMRYRFRSELGPVNEAEDEFIQRASGWFKNRLSEHAWHAWVVEGNQRQLLGHVFIQLIEKIPNPVDESEAIAYLTNFYIQPDLRSLGIGQKLMDEALAFCRAQSVYSIILWPSPKSIPFYRRNGFEVPAMLMERAL
jgi:GNAT superfamily N-acetyltransferase